jgi:antitoxin component YwqK of YwqJK toxin-antitoxin module
MNEYVNGLREGPWETYHKNGQLAFKGAYKQGVPDGYIEWWWSHGILKYKGIIHNNIKFGFWYYSNLTPINKEFYL